MQPEVLAAWVAAAAAAMSALVNAYITVRVNRHTSEMELVVSALNHFVGGSQERNAGIAALRVLSGAAATPDRKRRSYLTGNASFRSWHKYGHAVGRLFCGQLVYILTHGKNRFQAHEIANVLAMAEWLFEDKTLGFDPSRDHPDLVAAMNTY